MEIVFSPNSRKEQGRTQAPPCVYIHMWALFTHCAPMDTSADCRSHVFTQMSVYPQSVCAEQGHPAT